MAILIVRLNLAQLFVYKGLTICLAVVIGVWLQRDRSKRVGTNELVFIRVIFSLEFLIYRKAIWIPFLKYIERLFLLQDKLLLCPHVLFMLFYVLLYLEHRLLIVLPTIILRYLLCFYNWIFTFLNLYAWLDFGLSIARCWIDAENWVDLWL